MHEDFLRAIHNKNIIVIRFNSNEKGIISIPILHAFELRFLIIHKSIHSLAYAIVV